MVTSVVWLHLVCARVCVCKSSRHFPLSLHISWFNLQVTFLHLSSFSVASTCTLNAHNSHQHRSVSKNLCRKRSYWAQQTDLCHSDEVGDDGCSLRGGWLAEHHELDPLGDAVEKGDEAFQDGVIHCAAVHHKAVVVLKLKEGRSIGYFICYII